MLKRCNKNKILKKERLNINKCSVIINFLLNTLCITLILYEAIKDDTMNLYLSSYLILFIILSYINLYLLSKKDRNISNINSATARRRIDNTAFELYKCKDRMTGLYNSVFIENILKKIDNQKFLPTTIAVFFIHGITSIIDEEEKNEVICKVKDIVIKNKFKNNIACINENNNIVVFLINYNKNSAYQVAEKINDEFDKLFGYKKIKLTYGIEEMNNEEESIYNVLGQAFDDINLNIFR